MTRQLITIENKSTILTQRDVFQIAWGVNHQVYWQYGRSRWVRGRFAPPAHVVSLPAGEKPPIGAWNVILLDHSDQQGALGYHDDASGTKIPYAEVFAIDSQQDGSTVSAVTSHEVLEMLVDPFVDPMQPRTALRKVEKELYIVEVGDPVQGNDYDVGDPDGTVTGVLVADFALPAWWELEVPDGSGYSFRKSVTRPWEIAPQGYMSVAPANDPSNWHQIYGAQQDRRPAWASRLPRIHAA